MDRKTLEYMEERAKKGRKLVSKIAELANTIREVKNADEFYFQGISDNVYIKVKDSTFLEKIKDSYVVSVVEEIERLEQELAEL
jgi:hypothetical protein